MKALVVDDEMVSRKKMQAIIRNLGECNAVGRGEEAVEGFQEAMAKGKPFDLICLDIEMPEMSGIEVLKAIREIEEKHGVAKEDRVKIMMVSAASDKKNVLACLQSGCDNYVVKPFDKETVYAKLEGLGLK